MELEAAPFGPHTIVEEALDPAAIKAADKTLEIGLKTIRSIVRLLNTC